MSNDTVLSPGAGGDTIRGVDKGGVKTQVVILDGGGAGAESIWSAGQQLAINSVSVVLASDQATVTVSGTVSGAFTNAVLTDVWNSVTHVINTLDSNISNSYDAVNQRINVHEAGTAAVSVASLPLPTGAATEASLAVVAAGIATQGASGLTQAGPMIQGLVSDTPSVYFPDELRPISLTTEGRLRVATVISPTFLDFFPDDMPDLTDTSNPWYTTSPWQ